MATKRKVDTCKTVTISKDSGAKRTCVLKPVDDDDDPSAIFTQKSELFDITIKLEDKELYAPRSFLQFASPVFKAMLGTDFKEGQEAMINLPQKCYDDFLYFLKCLHPQIQAPITRKNVFNILPLAHQYQVDGLVRKCREKLVKIVSSPRLTKFHLTNATGPMVYHNDTISQSTIDKIARVLIIAERYEFEDVLEKGVNAVKETCPTEIFDNELFDSLSYKTKYLVAKAGFQKPKESRRRLFQFPSRIP